jgi:hypothetical protein
VNGSIVVHLSAVGGDDCPSPPPSRSTAGDRGPSTQYVRGSVGPRPYPDAMGRGESLLSPGIEHRPSSLAACSLGTIPTELYRLPALMVYLIRCRITS